MAYELLISHDNIVYMPVVPEEVTWETERKGVQGKLSFKVLNDGVLNFTEGDAVRFKVNGMNVFFGFVFTKNRDKEGIVSVTAYDQLRYLKNKDTYCYSDKTASELIKMIAADFNLQCGYIEDTKFKIESRIEDNQTLFDIIQKALDLTLQNRKEMYVMYDDFGKITLRNLGSMKLNILIDENAAENYEYKTSIDGETYDKIKLVRNNEKKGKREIYIAQDSSHINQWGVLQYFETIDENTNGKAKADALLKLYNQKTRSLSLKGVFGDIRVRGGSLVCVSLVLDDYVVNSFLLVEKVKHSFKESQHMMDLSLRGGEFIV